MGSFAGLDVLIDWNDGEDDEKIEDDVGAIEDNSGVIEDNGRRFEDNDGDQRQRWSNETQRQEG